MYIPKTAAVFLSFLSSSNNQVDVGEKFKLKADCVAHIDYWSSTNKNGTWWTAWQRSNSTSLTGGAVQYCGNITKTPTVSLTFNLDPKIVFAALEIPSDPVSSNGTCYSCTSKAAGCNRLWYRQLMNWKESDFWRRTEIDASEGCQPGQINNFLDVVHADWAATDGRGLPIIETGCSPCDQ